MRRAARLLPILLVAIGGGLVHPAGASTGDNWEVHRVIPGGRIDAVASLGNGIVLAGSRNPKPGHIFRSTDCGETWTDLGNLLGEGLHTGSVTCIASAGEGVAYLVTGDAHVWKSADWGLTWTPLGQVSDMPRLEPYHFSYSITVLPSGTVLISNTNPDGGHVFRSEDGGATWDDVGAISPKALYRFEKTSDGVLVNGWAGHVYKSADDGKTWADLGKLSDQALYATEYLEDGVVLQGGEDGRIFRSDDFGATWTEVARFPDSADDFVYLGNGVVLYSTYTGERNVYRSTDAGRTWASIGPVPAGAEGDTLDHAVAVPCGDAAVSVGGTARGNILRYRP
ncbi:MAG: hypothetical protein KF886_05975 [Candidatus Hydrogenedentes bacterium]|nr:hypothetical protein [Candidatus Hydrogenedentota bacterium]